MGKYTTLTYLQMCVMVCVRFCAAVFVYHLSALVSSLAKETLTSKEIT